jgi:hypothetical protein
MIAAFRVLFLTLCASASILPMRAISPSPTPSVSPSQTWPQTFDGRPIQPLPLPEDEARFHRGFPGQVGLFTDGDRQIILRWITAGTRRLHSSADCFRGLGYEVTPDVPRVDRTGARWTVFHAQHGAHEVRIRERILDTTSPQSWGDPSSWYWSTLLHQSHGPWMAISVVEGVVR